MIKKLLLLYILISVCSVYSQQAYYNTIDFSKSGISLKNDLSTLIINTHTNFLTYTPDVWEASKITDVNPENNAEVLLIYGYSTSGTTSRTRSVSLSLFPPSFPPLT